MSKLERLIHELCPNGVKEEKILNLVDCNIINLITPSIKIKKNDYMEVGSTPIISQELEFISGYCDYVDERIPLGEYVCFGDHSENIKYINFKFVQGADGLKIMRINEEELVTKYFYHAILNFYIKHNNYERHFKYLLNT